jgi:hypothetical protein
MDIITYRTALRSSVPPSPYSSAQVRLLDDSLAVKKVSVSVSVRSIGIRIGNIVSISNDGFTITTTTTTTTKYYDKY